MTWWLSGTDGDHAVYRCLSCRRMGVTHVKGKVDALGACVCKAEKRDEVRPRK